MGQPTGFVTGTETGLPARTSSSASRRSWRGVLGVLPSRGAGPAASPPRARARAAPAGQRGLRGGVGGAGRGGVGRGGGGAGGAGRGGGGGAGGGWGGWSGCMALARGVSGGAGRPRRGPLR